MADKRDGAGDKAGRDDDELDLNADWRDASMEDPDFSEKRALKVSKKVLTWGILGLAGVLVSGGIVYGIWAWTSDTPGEEDSKSPSAESQESGTDSEDKEPAEPDSEELAEALVEKKPDGPAVVALKRRKELRLQPLVTGKVRVNIPGKAVLWISGIKIGSVKNKILEIQEGEHLLRAIRGKNKKRQELSEVIDVVEGKLTRITVNFRRQKITVH